MIDFLIFCFAVVGMTHIIVDSTIMEPVRNLVKAWLPTKIASVIECYQCAGTWCGFFCGLIFWDNNFSLYNNLFITFLAGCAGSFLATLGATYLNYLEAKSVVEVE